VESQFSNFPHRVDGTLECNYSSYVTKALETKLTRIGNSRGLRLPAEMIRRYQLENGIIVEQQETQIVLKPKKALNKLSLEETAREMGAEQENWEEWDGTAADGLESCPWDYPLPPEALAWLKKRSRSKQKLRANK
jgi:antitoxin component of MazEF toxin-antitoxin module